MGKWFIRTAVWVFKADEGNIKMFVFVLFAFIVANHYDVLRLRSSFDETTASSLYLMILLPLYYLLATAAIYWTEQLFIRPKIKLVPAYDQMMYGVDGGYTECAVILVDIPVDWEIEDCYATLIEVNPVSYDDGRPIEHPYVVAARLGDLGSRRLKWKSKYQTDGCKINIGENSRDEILYVAKVEAKYVQASNKKEGYFLEGFGFFFCEDKPFNLSALRRGLYKITIRFNYTYEGRKMRPIYFKGYILTSSKPIANLMRIEIGEGDFPPEKRRTMSIVAPKENNDETPRTKLDKK